MSAATSAPQRFQRSRRDGSKMPERPKLDRIRYVGRPTWFGNPFAYRTRDALARVPAVDGSPWEYEGRISADGARHDYHHPDSVDASGVRTPGAVTVHHVRYMTRAETVELYRTCLLHPKPPRPLYHRRYGLLTVDVVRRELAGRDLSCWCKLTDPCHADVHLEVANATDEQLAEMIAAVTATAAPVSTEMEDRDARP